jgi:hypothetical protein
MPCAPSILKEWMGEYPVNAHPVRYVERVCGSAIEPATQNITVGS